LPCQAAATADQGTLGRVTERTGGEGFFPGQ